MLMLMAYVSIRCCRSLYWSPTVFPFPSGTFLFINTLNTFWIAYWFQVCLKKRAITRICRLSVCLLACLSFWLPISLSVSLCLSVCLTLPVCLYLFLSFCSPGSPSLMRCHCGTWCVWSTCSSSSASCASSQTSRYSPDGCLVSHQQIIQEAFT